MLRRLSGPLRCLAVLGVAGWTAGLASAQQAGLIGTLDGHTEPVYSIGWTPESKGLVTAGFDGTVRVWDAASRKEIQRYAGHTGLVLRVAASPDGRSLLSAGQDRTVRLWVRPGGGPLKDLTANPAPVRALAASPDGQRVAVAAGHGVKVWDLVTGNAVRDLAGLTGEVQAVAWRGDGAQIAAGDTARSIRLWNAADGTPQGVIVTPADAVLGLTYLSGNALLASAGPDGRARLWQLPLTEPRLDSRQRGRLRPQCRRRHARGRRHGQQDPPLPHRRQRLHQGNGQRPGHRGAGVPW